MSKTKLRILFAFAVIGCILPMYCVAQNTIVEVNPNGRDCIQATVPIFTTIQQGVDGVAPGGTVFVCAGVYREQVRITQPLTMRGIQNGNLGAAVIVPPANGLSQLPGTTTFPQILVFEVTSGPVVIDSMVVDGWNNRVNCAPIEGIYFYSSSGTIQRVLARNQKASVGTPECNDGMGIRVTAASNSATVIVRDNVVESYDLAGIVGQVKGSPATVTILNNTVSGPGFTIANIATHGIWVLDGPTALVTGNLVSDNKSTAANGSDGILIQGTHGAKVLENTVSENAYGIRFMTDATSDADNGTLTRNLVSESKLDGILLCSNNNALAGNNIVGSRQSGINLAATTTCSANNNTVTTNVIHGGCTGILKNAAGNGNTTTPNEIRNTTLLEKTGTSCP